MPIYLTAGLILVIGLILYMRHQMREQRRSALRQKAFPESWVRILHENMPLYESLPDVLKEELHGHIHVFLDEKTFFGCGGQVIDDEVRVTVAAQACVLLLNSPGREYKTLKSIMIYPSTYSARSSDDHDYDGDEHRLGESWTYGPIVLAWDAVEHGACDMNDGRNVVFHEFAHQLDQADGEADGAPDLGAPTRYLSWARVFSAEFEKLQDKARRGQKDVMDRYGATNPAEFFAVATETFYEKPDQMKKKHPELYNELVSFYHCDPADWR